MTKDELNGEVFSGVCAKADAAARAQSDLAQADTQMKNALLHAIADALDADASTIAAANGQDMQAAAARGMDAGKLDRLRFDEPRIAAGAEGVRHVASLPDPVGEIERGYTLENGLRLNQVHVPIGVIGMIYEARPNVTVDVASLCLKSGNAAILRGGHDAERSCRCHTDRDAGVVLGDARPRHVHADTSGEHGLVDDGRHSANPRRSAGCDKQDRGALPNHPVDIRDHVRMAARRIQNKMR